MRVRLAVVSVFVLLLVSLVHGVMQSAVLSGVVTDETGGVMPGVQVTVTAAGAATPVLTTTTDERWPVLRDEARARHLRGARSSWPASCTQRRTITIAKGQPPIVLSVTMGVGQLAETVIVTCGSALHAALAGVGWTAFEPSACRAGFNREEYRHTPENDFKRVSAHPLSTFSIDADTASYSNVRRFLNDDELPPDGAVRLEELINYFQFDYAPPRGDAPVGVVTEVSRCPWNEQTPARAGRRAREGSAGAARRRVGESGGRRCRATSCSCSTCRDRWSDRRQASAREKEHGAARRTAHRVAIASPSSSTPARAGWCCHRRLAQRRRRSSTALERLEAGGSTNGGEGIELAYKTARKQFAADAVNRVILVTDGDFNVGADQRGSARRLDRTRAQERRLPLGARRWQGQHR